MSVSWTSEGLLSFHQFLSFTEHSDKKLIVQYMLFDSATSYALFAKEVQGNRKTVDIRHLRLVEDRGKRTQLYSSITSLMFVMKNVAYVQTKPRSFAMLSGKFQKDSAITT